MAGAYTPDPGKKEEWLEQIASRPEISPEHLLGLFPSELIARIDTKQRELAAVSVSALVGFDRLERATTDEARLFNYAQHNMAFYDEGDDLLYEDPVLNQLLEARKDYGSEDYSNAVRLRRTVVAHYLVSTGYLAELAEQPAPDPSQKVS